jgi:2-oxoglutarate dehydrogenase E2 component (dihydrolipoamide succinyltransferase)
VEDRQTSQPAGQTGPGDGAARPDEPRVMPAAQRELAEHGLTAQQVAATGPGGRLLKEDVLRHVATKPASQPAGQATTEAPPASRSSAPAVRGMPVLSASAGGPYNVDDEVVPMSPLRRRVAQRLVEAQQTAALLTTFNEIDMSAVMELRGRYREAFQQKHGVKLGFMSFFVKATIEALKATPQINAEIRGADIVYHNYYDIGIAVGGGKGLVVPVVRGADRLSFAELELTIADLGQRARDNKITINELSGGTFTISNGGVYGSLLSTPIVNPPQSGIMGLHAIQDRPVAREGQVVIRPMMYVALTYDHRIVDGREAVLFLRHVKEVMEDPSRMLLEI